MKKKIIIVSIILFASLLTACNIFNASDSVADNYQDPTDHTTDLTEQYSNVSGGSASIFYRTFEQTLAQQDWVTDVVIAQYIGHRPFGQTLTEFEFVVSDWIFGTPQVPDVDENRIFIYVRNYENAHILGHGDSVDFNPGDLSFIPGVDYLLPLHAEISPYLHLRDNAFTFLMDIVINLDEPAMSMMYSESLADHSTILDFEQTLSRAEIISFITELTRDNPPRRNFIRSEEITNIVHGSPYILVVEITEPFRLSSGVSDWQSTDLYYVTIIQALKGDLEIGSEPVVIFFADTVQLGEQHIVAVVGDPDWLRFTSRDSLFRMDQLDEIISIINDESSIVDMPSDVELTFEEALIEYTTDMVVAQYVGHRPFGEYLIEFEFIVEDWILGDSRVSGADENRVFVYVENSPRSRRSGRSGRRRGRYRSNPVAFTPRTEYLLPLTGIDSPYAMTHENGFTLIYNTFINLDDPSESRMDDVPLSYYSASMDFDDNTSREDIVSLVTELTSDIQPADDFIRSTEITDIIQDSPYIMVVEINEILVWAGTPGRSMDWEMTNLYQVTAVQVLSGDIEIGANFIITAFSDTIQLGERHIVAVEPRNEWNHWFEFTSRDSLFSVEQLDEIISILNE